jgi:ABC-type transport system involved in Fe-S cluster assembly fused permease/ATPase subunit
MLDPLTILHLVTNPILCLPLLSLVRPAREGQTELDGIRRIKIQIITPRRGVVLTALCALAFTSCLDAAVLVVDLLSSPYRKVIWGDVDVVSWVVYSFGGFLVWSLAAILAEWRMKWGDKALSIMGALAFVGEVTNLPLLILKEVHYGKSVFPEVWSALNPSAGPHRIFKILPIPPSCLRLFLLLILVVAVTNPRVTYEDATESSALLNGDSGSTSSQGQQAYGTFIEDGISRATSLHPGTNANASGAQTPATGGPANPATKLKIPKKLGEKKEEDKPLTWKEFYPKIKKLSPHLWPSTSPKLQAYCLLCISIVLVVRFLNPLVPISLGRLVRALTKSEGQIFGPSVWPPFITYFVIRGIMTGGVLDFIRSYFWVFVYQYTDREMMMLCFNHLLNLSLAYHTKRNTGEVMRIIDRGSAVNNLFQTLLFTAIPTLIDIAVAFGVLFYLYGPTIALVTLVTMVVYISVSFTMTKARVRYRREYVERDVKQRGIVNDVLTNWESVKYFTAEQREHHRFREAVVAYQETEANFTISYQLLNLIQAFLLTLGLLVGSLLIAYRVIRGQADAAEFVVFLQYFQQLSRPLDNLGSLYRQINTNTTDAEKMLNLLAQATEVNDKPDAKDLVVTDGVIEFDNVFFSYNDKVQALKGVSFKIGKGESMALVGESGSGKSTILRLLYRFYDIDSGTIYIDGQDISKVTQLSLRRAIGIVPQDSVLWNDSIGANVGYGKEDATDEEIIAAAQAAKLHDKILGFPEQYETIVGERGVRLSGGEKQRVSLARMFLKSPAILVSCTWQNHDGGTDSQVLDEATSALDTETEREIQRALADLVRTIADM